MPKPLIIKQPSKKAHLAIEEIKPKKCTPLYLKVIVAPPGSKIQILLEIIRTCKVPEGAAADAEKEPVWELDFTLAKWNSKTKEYAAIITVVYAPTKPAEQKAVSEIGKKGLTDKQAEAINTEIAPKLDAIDSEAPDPEKLKDIHAKITKILLP